MIEKPPRVEPAKPLASEKPSTNGSHHPIREEAPKDRTPYETGDCRSERVIAVIAILAFFASWIQKWLWMRELGYAGIFWTLFSVRWELFCAAFVVVSLYLWLNLRLAARNGGAFRAGGLTK